MNKTDTIQMKKRKKNNLRFILGEVWQADKFMIIYTVYKNVTEGIFYVFSYVYLTKYIFQCIQNRIPFVDLLKVITIICLIHVVIHITSAGHSYYLKVRTPEVYRAIYRKVIDKAVDMEYPRFESPDFYDTFTRALDETVTRATETVDTFSWFLSNTIAAILASIIVIQTDFVLLIFLIPSIVASFYFGSKAMKVYFDLDYKNTRERRITTYIKRVFYEKKYAGEIRLFGIKNVLLKRQHDAFDRMYNTTKKLRIKAAKFESIRWGLFPIVSICIPFLYIAIVVHTNPNVDVAAYLALAVTLGFVSGNISDSVEKFTILKKHSFYVENLRNFLEYEPESKPTVQQQVAHELDDIEFKNMTFKYKGAEKPTLNNINLKIKKGERVAFVGHNGAGKTTLVKVLMGLYDVTEGEIDISGKNIKYYEPTSYHDHFGTVFQDLQVFALPISHNVLMREPKNEEERKLVVEALEKAQFGDKLKTLPNGIDTMVSKEFDENGVVLSGGETQKIAIARIFAKNPDIAILDEPSSALDPIAEYNMYKNMMNVGKGKTVIFISHRLSSARVADKIYMLENGSVIEEGTHDELMALNGKYAAMFNLQAQNYQESLPEGMEDDN